MYRNHKGPLLQCLLYGRAKAVLGVGGIAGDVSASEITPFIAFPSDSEGGREALLSVGSSECVGTGWIFRVGYAFMDLRK